MNPATAGARTVVDELVAAGITEAVLCPGSRSAPLAFALHAADATGRLRLHVRVDERTAGFLALGLALRSACPVPVTCTSGTAAANLHPAVLEASHAGVPLLAITADRPPELVRAGANQTTVQPGLYARAPRRCVDLVVAGRVGGEPASWRAEVRAAVAAARGAGGHGPGPVHLNVPFAEPLVPESAPGDGRAPGDGGAPEDGGAAPADAYRYAEQSVAADPLPLDPAAPTLVIAGTLPAGVAGPAVPPGVPVVAEPSSPLWPTALRAGPWLLGADPGPPAPAQVVLHGRPTLHRAVSRLLAHPGIAVYAVAGTAVAGWPASVRAVGSLPALHPPPAWCQRWAEGDTAAAGALHSGLRHAPTGLRLAAALITALPDGALLTLGSSNPVRDAALAARPRAGLTVLANRGVAGIDGTVSTAAGAALAHRARGGGPGYALLGDLTVLHDLTGLVVGPDEPSPDLTIVVLNDVGGGIFTLLEQGAPEHAASFERIFGTPHRVRLDAVCAGLGLPHRRLTDVGELPDALAPADGPRMIEVPARRDRLREGHQALRARVHEAVRRAV